MPAMSDTVWMWRRAWALVERAERLQRQIFEPGAAARPAHVPVWEPPIDVYETAAGFHVVVALPAVDPERLELAIDGRVLTIAGHCRRPSYEGAVVRRMEIPHGCFERRIALPAEGFAIGSHELVDGCLILLVRRAGGADRP